MRSRARAAELVMLITSATSSLKLYPCSTLGKSFDPLKVLDVQNIGYANHPLFPETLPLAQLHMYRVFGPIKVLNMERLGECANHPAALSSLKLYPCSTLGKSFMHGVF